MAISFIRITVGRWWRIRLVPSGIGRVRAALSSSHWWGRAPAGRRWPVIKFGTRAVVAMFKSTMIAPSTFVACFRIKSASNINLVHRPNTTWPTAWIHGNWTAGLGVMIHEWWRPIIGWIPIMVVVVVIVVTVEMMMIWRVLAVHFSLVLAIGRRTPI